MKTEEIIEMARQAGFISHGDSFYTHHRYGDCKLELEAFAKLVAAKEREACALICDATVDYWVKAGYLECAQVIEAMNIAEEIRARGEA